MASNTKKTISEALAAFQAELPAISLDGTNPHFRSKYATLGNVTRVVFPKLAEHGFSFTTGSFVDNGVLVLDAHLLHESGESRSMQFPITETNPQKVGSAVTYYRRYALAALTGVVADEDDDGNAASQPSQTQQRVASAQQAIPAKKAAPATAQGADKERLDVLNGVLRSYVGDPRDEAKSKAVNGALAEVSNTEKNAVKQRELVIRKVLEQDVSGRSNEEIKKKFGLD